MFKLHPEETTFSSTSDGLEQLRTDQAVMHVKLGIVTGFVKANPHVVQRLQVIDTEIHLPFHSKKEIYITNRIKLIWNGRE